MGQTMTAGQAAYFEKLRAALPAGFPLTVTSAGRTPEEQASAMLSKVQKYGAGSLNIYADKALIARLLSLPRDVTSWASVIRSDGMRLSRHLWGGALDLRTRDLSATQLAQLQAAVVSTGGKALVEEDHLHADLPALYTAGSYIQTGVTAAAPVLATAWLWSVALGSVALVSLYAYQKHKTRTNPRPRLRKNRGGENALQDAYFTVTSYAPDNSILRLRADELLEDVTRRGFRYSDLRRMQEMQELAEQQYRRRR